MLPLHAVFLVRESVAIVSRDQAAAGFTSARGLAYKTSIASPEAIDVAS
jgi:hypothetical protein